MRRITQEQLAERIKAENPWWQTDSIGSEYDEMKPRAYFLLFFPLARDLNVKRALVLMGPRRVGKTVLLHHVIRDLLASGVSPRQIAFVSVDHPLYNGLGLEDLVTLYRSASGADNAKTQYLFFDEIQYLKNWQIHLKSLVDSSQNTKFIVSGSAAAALSLKSRESGAGRFTDFLLPPLTFYEYLSLIDGSNLLKKAYVGERALFQADDISLLNRHFIDFLNFGGYPEAIFSERIQENPTRFIKRDIIDKVLLRDLPSLYGISDIQELNRLFTTLAFNTADEISLQDLASDSGVAKNTIKRYMEYLEAAFLIRRVHRIDESAARFTRARHFKVYLTNPSMRAPLFTPVKENSPELGALAETAIFSQYFHHEDADLFYSRWGKGEVDIVRLNSLQKPLWALEVKWSDRYFSRPGDLSGLREFCSGNKLKSGWTTTKTRRGSKRIGNLLIHFIPTSELCYTIGHNIITGKCSLNPDVP